MLDSAPSVFFSVKRSRSACTNASGLGTRLGFGGLLGLARASIAILAAKRRLVVVALGAPLVAAALRVAQLPTITLVFAQAPKLLELVADACARLDGTAAPLGALGVATIGVALHAIACAIVAQHTHMIEAAALVARTNVAHALAVDALALHVQLGLGPHAAIQRHVVAIATAATTTTAAAVRERATRVGGVHSGGVGVVRALASFGM
jgi:hypothetical protein